MLNEKRISVIMNCKIKKIKGSNKLEAIHFTKDDKENKDEELFLKPDIVIAENGVGEPKFKLNDILSANQDPNIEPPM